MMDAYVARQPIFDGKKQIYAYELLFRDGTANFVPDIDGDVATTTVLSNSFFSIGMDTMVGKKKSFINFTQNLLVQKVPLLLPKQSTVVEILEDVVPAPDLLEACSQIAKQGYTLALDDFVYSDELRPLIEMADIIKFDFRLTPFDQIEAYLSKLPPRPIRLLAEKVETHEEFKQAVTLGFELFQGYFFCKPEIIKGKEIAGSQLNMLQIMAEVNQRDFDFDHLENLIAPDVSLSYKLLRYINSAFFAKVNRIGSIKQALVYMGEAEIRRFVSLIGMSNLAKGKPNELIRMACIRGKFCELLADVVGEPISGAELFTLGMFSLIDAIVDQPMGRVMGDLPLADDIKSALATGEGPLVPYLKLAQAYEKGDWPAVVAGARMLGADESKLPPLYLEACQWSNTLTADS